METNSAFFGVMSLLSLIGPLFGFFLVCLTIGIAVYAHRQFPGTASNLIAIGVALKTIFYFTSYFVQYFLMQRVAVENISFYFTINSILASVGGFIFLLGILKLLQQVHATNQEALDN